MDNQRYHEIFSKIQLNALGVLHMYFEQNVLNKQSFKDFLQDIEHLHDIFHAAYPEDPCCQCINGPDKCNTKITPKEFMQLYDLNKMNKNKDHHKTDNKRKLLIQDCVCPISVKQNLEIDSMDTGLTCKMIKLCCNSTTLLETNWLDFIMKIRNDFVHNKSIIDKSYFDANFKEMKTMVLNIAKTVGIVYKKQTEQSLESLMGDIYIEGQQSIKDMMTVKLNEICVEVTGLREEVRFLQKGILPDDKKYYAEWEMDTPDHWNAEKIVQTLVSFANDWFTIEYVFVGSLIISTSVSGSVLSRSEPLHEAIESFLRDFIELCEIDTSISTILKIKFRVFDNKASSVQSLISHKDKIDTSHHCILNEEGCSDTEQSQTPDTEREDSFILEGKQKTLHKKGERRASIDVPKRRNRTRSPMQELQGDHNTKEGSSRIIYRRSRSTGKSLKKSKDTDSGSSNLEENDCENDIQVSSSKAEIQQSEQDKTEYSHRRASSDPDQHTISETYFYRLCVLLVVIAQDVSRKYFSVNILKSKSLRNYLERYKHCLFHLYSNMKCCGFKCNNEQTKIFSKEQFDMLFENDRTKIISSHTKKSCSKTDQTCICGIQPKEGIDVDMLDVTLITSIALTCEKDIKTFERHCIETCLGTIEETRNKVFHYSDIKKMSVVVFEYYWLKLSGSVEVICKFINKKYQHKIQERIQELKSRALVTSDMLKQEELCRAEWRHKCAEFEIIANSELLENEELYSNFMTGKAHHEIFTKIDRLNSDIEKTQIHFYGSEKVSQMLDLSDPETYSGKAFIPVLLLLEVPEKWNKQRIMDSAYKMKNAMKQDRNIEIKSCSAEDLNILAYIFWKMFSDIQKLRLEMQLFIGSILTFAGINTTKKESIQVSMFINDQHKQSQRRRGSHLIRYRNKNIPMF